LFFDENWTVKPDMISCGHNIETSWLLQEAPEIIDDEDLLGLVKKRCAQIAAAASGVLDQDGRSVV
jgi:mannobiose 2-epimerase